MLLSVKAAQAELGGVSRWTILRLIASGDLAAVRVRRRRMIRRDSLEGFIRRESNGSPTSEKHRPRKRHRARRARR